MVVIDVSEVRERSRTVNSFTGNNDRYQRHHSTTTNSGEHSGQDQL